MDDLIKNLTGRRLKSSEVFSISKAFVPRSKINCKDSAWVHIAKNLLRSITKQNDDTLSHNVYIFIELSVKADIKSCKRATAKFNRKICLQISDLLSYIHCIEEKDVYSSLSMSELDIGSLKAILLAAVIDIQVKGVPSGDDNVLVTELYTKLTLMFEKSLETLCDCLLLCRCIVFKDQRKPSVLIPLLRRVILCSGSTRKNVRFRFTTSPVLYIKLLLLAKILLFMVETNEVLAVHSLVARALRVPDFFRDWLDQTNIPWLSQIDKNHIKVKNILKCMKVSTVLETLYGTSKVTDETLGDINYNKERKKSNTNSYEKGLGGSVDSNIDLKGINSIFTSDSLNWPSPSNKQRERKVNVSPLDLQIGLKRSLSKEEIINHRKRIRRDSLTFSVTNFVEKNTAPANVEEKSIWKQEKDIHTQKVSIGIQTDDCLLNESEFEVEIRSAMTETTIGIDKDLKVLKPKLDSPGHFERSKIEITKKNSSKEHTSNKMKDVFQNGLSLYHNGKVNSLEVGNSDYSSSQNINEDSDSDIEVIEEVFVAISSPKSPKEVEFNPSDENSKMLTNENRTYHEIRMEKEKRQIEDIMQLKDLTMQKINEKNVHEQILSKSVNDSEKNHCEIIQDIAVKGTIKKVNTQNEDILNSENNKIYLKNGQELGRSIVLTEFQIEKINISAVDLGKTQVNKEFSLLSKDNIDINTQANKDFILLPKDKIDIAENEELEVLSTPGVKGDDKEEQFSIDPCVTEAKNALPESSQRVSNDDAFNLHHNSSSLCLRPSQNQSKLLTDIKNRDDILSMKQKQPQRIHEEFNIGAHSDSCNLNNQSHIKVDVTLPTKTKEDLQRQVLTKNISNENIQDKKQINDMNDSTKNKINKTDKKNEKLKVGENYGRINYLVQASRKVFKCDESISSQLGSLAISFGRRLPQVRLDPLLKREMCKGCGVYLVYGVNAKVRHKSKRQKHLVITCLTCHTIKRFVTNPQQKLWSEQPDARV